MANTLQIKRSTTAGNVPSLDAGELGVNLPDRKLWVGGNGAGNIALGGDGLYLNRLDGRVRLGSKWGHFPETTGTVHYVDAANGSDSNSGTIGSPKATVISAMGNVSAGDTVVMYAGTYDMANYFLGSSNNITAAYSINTTFIAAEPGKVKWTNIEEFTTTTACTIKYYGIWFSSSTAVWTHLTGNQGASSSIRYYYNCFFKGLSNSLSWGYDGQTHMFNCTVDDSFNSSYSNGSGTLQNTACTSAFTYAPGTHPSTGAAVTSNTNLPSISLGVDANISSSGWENTGTGRNPDGTRANIGVYGGPFAWTKGYAETFGNAPDAAFTNLVATGDLSAPNIDGKPDSYTKLLIHSDTTDGRGTFTDSSPSGHAITASSTAHHETDQSKFGATSMHFDGSGDKLSVTGTTADFGFGAPSGSTNDFTIDLWCNLTAESAYRYHHFFTCGAQAGTGRYTFKYYHNPSNTGTNVLYLYGNDGTLVITAAGAVLLGDTGWHHLAVVRSGTTLKIYVDGVEKGSATSSATIGGSYTGLVGGGGAGAEYAKGYIDELRVSKGIARWTAAFTPPTRPYATFSAGDGVFTGELSAARLGIGTAPLKQLHIKDSGSAGLRVESTSLGARDYDFHTDGYEVYIEGVGGSSGSFQVGENGTFPFKVDLGGGGSGDGGAFYLNSSGNLLLGGTVTWASGGSANANTAYTYSQVGHLPLAGGTLTGALTGTSATFSGAVELSTAGSTLYLRNAENTGNHYIRPTTGKLTINNASGTEVAVTSTGLAVTGTGSFTGALSVTGATTLNSTLQTGGGAGINGSIVCTSTENNQGLKRDTPANAFSFPINISSIGTAPVGTFTIDGKFDLNDNHAGWNAGFKGNVTYPRVANRCLEFTVDTADSGTNTTQADHTMVGWYGSGTTGTHSELAHAVYLDCPASGTYILYVFESGVNKGAVETVTWGDVIVFRIILKATGADYYYKRNDGPWTLGYVGGTVTTSNLTAGMSVHSGRYHIHSIHVYDKENIFTHGPLNIRTSAAGVQKALILTNDVRPSSTLTGVGAKIEFSTADANEGPSTTATILAKHTAETFNASAVLEFSAGNTGTVHQTITSAGNILIGTASTLYASGAATFGGALTINDRLNTSSAVGFNIAPVSNVAYNFGGGASSDDPWGIQFNIANTQSANRADLVTRYYFGGSHNTNGKDVTSIATTKIVEPNLTNVTGTITNAYNLIIGAAATEATNNYSLLCEGAATFSGALTVSGAAQFNTIGSNLVGAISTMFDLGTASLKWRNLNMSGTATIGGGVSVTGSSSFEGASFSSAITGASATFGSATTTSNVAVRIETDNASTYTPALQLAWGGDVVGEVDFQFDTRATTGFKIGTTAATHPVSLVVDDVPKIYISGYGNVGINSGTTTPIGTLQVNDTSLSVIAGTVTVDRAATNKFTNGDFASDGTGWTFGSWTTASYSYTFPAFSGSGVSGFSKVCRIERDASGGVAHFHQSSIFANSTVFSVGLWVRGDGTFRINSHWGILKTLALTSTWQYMTVTTTSNATSGHFIYLAADLITTYCEVTGVMIEQAATASTFTDVSRSSGDIVLHGQVKSFGTGTSYFKGALEVRGGLTVSNSADTLDVLVAPADGDVYMPGRLAIGGTTHVAGKWLTVIGPSSFSDALTGTTAAFSGELTATKSTNGFFNGLSITNSNTGSSGAAGLYLISSDTSLDMRVLNSAAGDIGYINSSGTLYTGIGHDGGLGLILKGGNVGIGTASPGNWKLYVNGDGYIDGDAAINGGLEVGALTSTTAGTAAATAGHNWYSAVDANYIVKVKDGNEVYFEKESSVAGYNKWIFWGEQVGRNFDLSFRLKGGVPPGYRHFGIAIAGDGGESNSQYDMVVLRHGASASTSQIRIDRAGSTEQSLVSSSVPRFFDGTERHVLIQVRNQEYTIEVDGVLEHSFRASARTRQRGIVGFTIYEAASSDTWATIRNFKIKHYSTHKTMLPPTQVGETREGNDGLVIAGLYSTTNPALTFTTGHGSAGNTNTWDLGAITCDDDGSYNGKMAFRVSSGSGLNAGRHGGFATAMTIKQTTNVGIGTTDPGNYKLYVVGDVNISAGHCNLTAGKQFQWGSGNCWLTNDTSYDLLLATYSTGGSSQYPGLRIAGNNGAITVYRALTGTTATFTKTIADSAAIDYLFEIAGKRTLNAVEGQGVGIRFKIPSWKDSLLTYIGAGIGAVRESATDSDVSTALTFSTSQNDATLDEAMRITSGGGVAIGSTAAAPWKLYVNGITKINGALEVNGQLAPSAANTYDLGNSTNTWRNLYLKGTAEIDSTLTVGGVITNHESKPVSIYGFASNHTHTFYVAGDSDKFYRVLIAANHAREVIVWRTYNETVGGTASDWNNNHATHYGAMTFHATFQTDDWGGHQKILTGWVAQNYTNVLARANLPGGANYSTIALWLRGGAGGSGAIYHYTIRGGNAHASAATVDYTNSLGSADAEYNFSSDARYINPHNRKHYKLATVDSISCGGTLVATGNFTTQGYVQHTGWLYSRNNLAVLNAAGTGWNTWATRSSGQFNLNVGTITSGALTGTTATFSGNLTQTAGVIVLNNGAVNNATQYLRYKAATNTHAFTINGGTQGRVGIGADVSSYTTCYVGNTMSHQWTGGSGRGMWINPGHTPTVTQWTYGEVLRVEGAITEGADPGSGWRTHPWFRGTYFKPPTITAGTADVDNSAVVYIEQAMSCATANYAFYINSGNSYFGGKIASDFLPSADNTYALGNASYRWSSVNAVTGTFGGALTGTTATFSGLMTAANGHFQNSSHTIVDIKAHTSGDKYSMLRMTSNGTQDNYIRADVGDLIIDGSHSSVNITKALAVTGALTGTSATFSSYIRANYGIQDDGGSYGTSGQVLKSGGTGVVNWANESGGSNIVTSISGLASLP